MVNDKIESANMTKIVLNKGSLLQQRVEVIMKTPVFLLIGSFVSFNYGIHFVWSSFKSFALTAGDDKSLCRATWLETDQHASHSLDLWFALTGKLRSKPRGDQLSTGSVCSISQRSAPLRSSWTRRRLQQRENSQPGRYSQMQRRSETPDKNPPATDSGQEEGERERGKGKGKKKKKDETDSQLIVPWIPAVISRVFPTYPLYTTSKRFALWNHLCDIWANRRTAREVFKRATNRRAGKQRLGVSPGVHHETAAGRSWDEDAGGCGASSVQLGCSDSCPVRVLFTLFSSSSFLFFFFYINKE